MRFSILLQTFATIATVVAIPADASKPTDKPAPPAVTSKPDAHEAQHEHMTPTGPTTLIRLKDVYPAASGENGEMVIGTAWKVPNPPPAPTATSAPKRSVLEKRTPLLCEFTYQVSEDQMFSNVPYICNWLRDNNPVGYGDWSTVVRWQNWPQYGPDYQPWPRMTDINGQWVVSLWQLGAASYLPFDWNNCFNTFWNMIWGCTTWGGGSNPFGGGYDRTYIDNSDFLTGSIYFQ
ncbi:hypothetical protein TWF694_006024 [Orbilia ellipsospora]|uniref:Uncharacterized protein n=1 Tax=Orbilia ellipsospora TaxID=2528407 RepID=A0AAV9WRW8_9PEZI